MAEPERGQAERAAAILAAATDADIDAATGLDRRRKSRLKEFAERAQKAGEIGSPVRANLNTMDGAETVADMARAGMEPDWSDNPDDLDTPSEVRASLRETGEDPMDVSTPEQAAFGHSLLHAYANDPNRGGRTVDQLEAEHDMVVEAMLEFGMDHGSELDHDDIRGHGRLLSFDDVVLGSGELDLLDGDGVRIL